MPRIVSGPPRAGLVGELDWGATASPPASADPHELASWVNEIEGYEYGKASRCDSVVRSALAANLIHPRAKLVGVWVEERRG